MKINKYQFYTVAFGLVSSLSLGYIFYLQKKNEELEGKIVCLEQEITQLQNDLEDLKEIEEISSIDDLNKYFKGRLIFSWNDWYVIPQLVIEKPEQSFGNIEISETLYRKINEILSARKISSLQLVNLGSEIDLSNLNIFSQVDDPWTDYYYLGNTSNDVVELIVQNCQEGFDYQALCNIKPQQLEISLEDWNDSIKEWLEGIDLKDSSIMINSHNSSQYLEFFIETGKEINTLKLIANADEEPLQLLSEIHAKTVIIDSRNYVQGQTDFNLSLNEDTDLVELSFVNCDFLTDYYNYLGKVKITSPNTDLHVDISSYPSYLEHFISITYITENTSFDLPENATISFYNIRYSENSQQLYGVAEYERNKDLDFILDQVMKENPQKKIGGK